MKFTIDAQGKKIGRVAAAAAARLMNKHSASFTKNTVATDQVEIINASKTDMSAKKKQNDTYVTYTGYRGGLKSETLGELIERKGMKDVYIRAIERMIPRNKLHTPRMKNLIIKD
ncbi:MAG TPA: uL13 family ribosomal protein [Candidatus Paceibacterota bacterium]